jgi:2,4-dienoyl-CoA reductase-like NADH-dependent reductase (Old Yellow Enzyme family)
MSDSVLFQSAKIGTLELPNRMIRSATWEGLAAADGGCTDELVRLMGELAEGGVGLIISSHAYVRPEGFAVRGQLGIDRDECIPGLARMTEAVHGKGGRIVLQLAHGGVLAGTQLTGQPALAPSLEGGPEKTRRREMTEADIGDTIRAYGEAALRARKAGFDGVQIHAAHGYLLNQFLSPWFNRRSDRWGGTIENRARIIVEILASVRSAAGGECPVLVKMNSEDFTEGGLTREDSLRAAVLIASAGADAIELSGGTLLSGKLSPSRSKIDSVDQEAYFRDAARAFKAKLNIPLALVGGIRSFEVAEALVKEGIADFVSMSRPFIREPDLVNRWKRGDRRRATCVSDNRCFMPPMRGTGFYCVVEKEGRAEEQKSGGSEKES